MHNAQFDQYSGNYEQALAQGLAVSGEDSSYFAQGRLNWLKQRLEKLAITPSRVLDFGCGVGNSLPLLESLLGAQRITGIDVSADSIAVAQERFAASGYQLQTLQQLPAESDFDLVFCNGVFHHIPLAERSASAELVYRYLKPGGLFAMFENNPLNPGTRYVMRRIPFDRDAITLMPWTARQLLRSAGFDIVRTDYLFYFPKLLAMLRPLEPWFSQLPFGAQYLVLARRGV